MKIGKLVFCLISSLSAIGLTTEAQALVIRNDRPDSFYRELAGQYPSVGKILVSGGGTRLCSGTLVNPQWVVSASHCLKPNGAITDVSGSFTINDTKYNIESVQINPGFVEGKYNIFESGYDVGLVKLNAPVAGVKPAEISDDPKLVGKNITTVGYGLTGTGLTGQVDGTEGIKRAGENSVDALGPDYNKRWSDRVGLLDFDAPDGSTNVLGSPTPLFGEFTGGQSDSGGGAFINGKLVGVHAGSPLKDKKYGHVFGVTRLAPNLNWIQSTISGKPTLSSDSAEVASNGEQKPVGGDSGTISPTVAQALSGSSSSTLGADDSAKVPEPSTLVALILTGGMLGLFRRRN
jgi:secreted trypsin-like serine protease